MLFQGFFFEIYQKRMVLYNNQFTNLIWLN